MSVVLGILFLVISFCVGYAILWMLGVVRINPPKQEGNPYIEYHKQRQANDANYDKYLEWVDKNKYSLPVDKVTTPEEDSFKEEINNIL